MAQQLRLPTFLTGLKRRQVFQVAALSSGVVWSPYCATRIVNFDAHRRYSVAQAVKFEQVRPVGSTAQRLAGAPGAESFDLMREG